MEERFIATVSRDDNWPGELIVLQDRQAGSWARIVPELGCNLVSFGATLAGREVEAMLQPTDEERPLAPSSYGAPVLFPFPNRLRGGRAEFAGRSVRIDRAPGQANAIHGMVRHVRWHADRLGGDAGAATACCSIDADESVLRQFPFPFHLALTFLLNGSRLRVEIQAQNTGDGPMPMGFGWHPYFRLPLVTGANRGDAVVAIPAAKVWKLDEELIPTGETIPVPPAKDFRLPRALGDTHLDDVYTDVDRSAGHSGCSLTDPESGVRLRTTAGPSFREWVVFAPSHRPTICFEPYTCPTNAFNLEKQGRDVGVIALQPLEQWQDWIELHLEG